MWTETIRNIAAEGKGNLITFDGSVDGMERTIRQLMAAEGLSAKVAYKAPPTQ